MKNVVLFYTPVIVLSLLACNGHAPAENENQNEKKDSSLGKVEFYDTIAYSMIDSNATVEMIGQHYNWSEGPVWIASKQVLLFSDVPENKIYRWQMGDTPVLYLTPSGYTDTAFRDGENGSNGLTLDKQGRLLMCQSGNRVVSRLNASLDSPRAAFTVLASNYNGKKFNSPNDLIEDSKGNIYFTDPIYGLPKGEDDPERELNFEGVYRIGSDGKIVLLIDSIPRPNGIALSPGEHTLYLASSDNEKPRWYAYKLGDGKIMSGGVLLDALPLQDKAAVKQGPDGFKIDKQGNIFSAGPDGINIISPEGKLLALIRIFNRRVSNCAFDETGNILFVTADDAVLRVNLHP